MREADLAAVDDRDLLRVFDRDPQAVEEFYRRHVRVLGRYLTRAVGNPHDAADLSAATFISAMESAARYDPSCGEPRAWLFGIARNLVAMRWRRLAAEGRAMDRLGGRHDPEPDAYEQLEDRMDADHLAGPALAAVPGLPPAERELLESMVRSDLTVTEAAAELGIRSGTARMRLARARARLFRALPAKEEEGR
ncbi:RNA polymerase sigma factor [Paractinoplanes rishiriensis]|uniref:DNA-directed RNA polymerase sigma-70 factor n=1 Tax=Paractinoplanes rishiriensis TaxID=1050105 RepID=A0A919JYF6_9ACTN|nr:sigma-70 family RNA polymerase sigma factor [Actinoplanes rishiriensis]GIE97200.1 DNA-directed RNA polymerase sigma-70 factor [Actinoplanes rishiriensis]